MKILTVIGARPQFIKAWPMSRALRAAGMEEYIVHTGQHYDYQMSEVFFRELDIPRPDCNLQIGSGSHGRQTGAMLDQIEQVLVAQRPTWVVVFGDTNSTIAAALAAAKLQLPIAHIEAGLRSFNRRMPEEINRVLTDHLSTILFCPTATSVENLSREGVTKGVHLVGDVMHAALSDAAAIAAASSNIMATLELAPRQYAVATIHRAENTDHLPHLCALLTALSSLPVPVILPIHPRTRRILEESLPTEYAQAKRRIRFLDPLGYIDMVKLAQNAITILTDSGGLQKEAFWLGVPCITLREETEWVETVQVGANFLAGTSPERIRLAWQAAQKSSLCPIPPPPGVAAGVVSLLQAASG
jgi:UDP-N-acetylglucosamine 2-epimerase